jgi:uncharacterized membrane protein YeaQ/YmgE (transglycosylase-associated protein family)
MAQVLSILLTGFVTGALARFAVPGPDPMPAWLTVLIGLAGSLAGFGIVYAVEGEGDPAWTGIAGFLGSIALVLAYRRFVQKRAIWGHDAYRFPERGFGVPEYRERLQRAGIDPDTVGSPFTQLQQAQQPTPETAAEPDTGTATAGAGDDPTENPAHYLGLLEELHDNGVLDDPEYDAARTRLLNRLRA